jgi:hypothetical protein
MIDSIHNPEHTNKISLWENASKIVDGWHTVKETENGNIKIGVDPQMRELLVALLSLGLNTESSCWGHDENDKDDKSEHINPDLAPYVTIIGHLPDREYTPEEVESACNEAREYHKKINKLLEEFYKERLENNEQTKIKIIYFDGMPSFRLISVTENEMEKYDENTRKQLLHEIHKEWADFSSFLKKKILG